MDTAVKACIRDVLDHELRLHIQNDGVLGQPDSWHFPERAKLLVQWKIVSWEIRPCTQLGR